MKIYTGIEQGSEAWLALRMGIPTASEFHRIITPKKAELSKGATDYALRLVAERLLNAPLGASIPNPWVERGKDMEPEAVRSYEWQFDVQTVPVTFITNDEGTIGCSPDRIVVSDERLAVEIKCPAPHVHIGYLLNGTDDDYRAQVQGQIYVAELARAHLYSFHERCPPALIENKPDKDYIAKLAEALTRFNENLFKMFERAKELGVYQPVPRATSPAETLEAADIAKMFKRESAMRLQKEGFVA